MSNKKLIHIHAKCDAFETFDVLPEKKALSKLVRIRNIFSLMQRSKGSHFVGNLVVKTGVLNPELQFK